MEPDWEKLTEKDFTRMLYGAKVFKRFPAVNHQVLRGIVINKPDTTRFIRGQDDAADRSAQHRL